MLNTVTYLQVCFFIAIALIVIGLIRLFIMKNSQNDKGSISFGDIKVDNISVGLTLVGVSFLISLLAIKDNTWIQSVIFPKEPEDTITLIQARNLYKNEQIDEALEAFKKLSMDGSREAQWHYGEMLFHGEGLPPKKKEGLNWIKKSADQGYKCAQALLGIDYIIDHNDGYADIDSAEYYLVKAAQQKEINGFYGLGLIELIQKNDSAEYWLKKAADLGHPVAQLTLLNILNTKFLSNFDKQEYSALSVLDNLDRIFHYASKCANQGRIDCMAEAYRIKWIQWSFAKKSNDPREKDYLLESYYYLKLYRDFSTLDTIFENESAIEILENISFEDREKLNDSALNFTPKVNLKQYHTHYIE